MLITYKTQKSKMHVEPNEGVLNEQHFFYAANFKSQFWYVWMLKR